MGIRRFKVVYYPHDERTGGVADKNGVWCRAEDVKMLEKKLKEAKDEIKYLRYSMVGDEEDLPPRIRRKYGKMYVNWI